MKKIFLTIILSVITFYSTFGQVNSISNEGIISINFKTKEVKQVSVVGNESDTFYNKVNLTFKCDESMQSFKSQTELVDYISNNSSKVNGIIYYSVDEEIIFTADVIDGVLKNGEIINKVKDKYPCSYRGIRQCAIDTIHSYNWYDMWVCVAAGLGCVIDAYGSCFADHCKF